jgi:hypothetical protein
MLESPDDPPRRSVSKADTGVVFDWDDTILPTTWLERQRVLHGPSLMRPVHVRHLQQVEKLAHGMFDKAESMGTVVIVTNAAPGWVEASCAHFLPGLLARMRQYPIHAKPMHAMVTTWKIECFKRECRPFSRCVSLGDGPVERQACLRLAPGKDIKSIKLHELPTVQQLLAQQGMIAARLDEIGTHAADLDLRIQVSPPSWSKNTDQLPTCTLVHITRLNHHKVQKPLNLGGSTLPKLLDGSSPKPVPLLDRGVATTPPRTGLRPNIETPPKRPLARRMVGTAPTSPARALHAKPTSVRPPPMAEM